jgi:hypothetical protein
MAKPPIGDLPPPWGDAGNYPASNYPVTLPDLSGQANPLQGATPWSGQPRLNATALTAFASAGAVPQVPQDASSYNEWLRRVQVHVSWVQDGKSTATADAHIMETDASGFSAAVKYVATNGIEGAGTTPVIFIEGGEVPTGKTLTLTGTGKITGSSGSLVDVDIVEQTTERFDDSGSTLPPNVRDAHWLETVKAVRMPDGGGGTVRAIAIPATGNDVSFSSSASIEDTTAAATFRAVQTEPVLITVKFGYRHTAAPATGLMNTRIEFSGPTDEEEFVEQWDLVSSAGWLPFSQDYVWTPTDTYITPGTRNYVATLRAGSNLGANLELRNVVIQVRSALQL